MTVHGERYSEQLERELCAAEAECERLGKQLAAPDAEIERLRAEVRELTAEPQWYWDDRNLDHATAVDEVGEYCDVGDVIELRPIRELPTVWALVTESGVVFFSSEAEAEAAKKV